LSESGIDDSDRRELTLAKARLLAENGRMERSMEVSRSALLQWPEDNDFRMQRAMALFVLERHHDAVAELRDIIARDGQHAPALNALGYTLADEDRNLDEAEELITRALHIDPDNAAYLDSFGWLRFRQGRLEHAVEILERAYDLGPNAEIGAHLGEVLWNQDRQDRALTVWEKALTLDAADRVLLDTLRRLAPELLPAEEAP
jgi:tetratricopeptide (TPR) repeat protein